MALKLVREQKFKRDLQEIEEKFPHCKNDLAIKLKIYISDSSYNLTEEEIKEFEEQIRLLIDEKLLIGRKSVEEMLRRNPEQKPY